MDIKTKYSIGDVVYYVKQPFPALQYTEECKACTGSGWIPLDGKHYTCPACNGQEYARNN